MKWIVYLYCMTRFNGKTMEQRGIR